MKITEPLITVAVTVVAAGALVACSSTADKPGAANTSQGTTSGANSTGNGSFAVASTKCPADATTPLGSGDAIAVGSVAPLSGPAAATAGYSQGMKTYFAKVNAEEGGIDGHKLTLSVKDDQYDPTKTVPQVTDLLTQQKVFALLGQAGTANVKVAAPLVAKNCTPDLWTISGASEISDPSSQPWVTGGYTLSAVEATAWAKYIAGKKAGASVALLEVDNDAGHLYATYFSAAAEKAGLKVVATEKFAPTATNVDSQVSAILAANPDFVVGAVLTGICGPFQSLLAQGGFHGGVLAPGYCGSKALLSAAGNAANGMIFATAYRDPTNPANADNADVKQFLSDLQTYGDGATASPFTIDGYKLGKLFVDTVKKAETLPGGLTRVNLMTAAWNMNTTLFDSYCGTAKTNGPADPFIDECVGLLQYDTTTGAKQIDSYDAEGKAGSLGH